jgi:hypothetical protein
MSITKEKIIANTKRYLETAKGEKFGFMTPELEELLGEEFITAPASAMLKLHNAFEGGLIDHIIRVMGHAYNINNGMVDNLKVPMKSLIKVVYLHQIGKAKLFIPNKSEWHKTNLGKMYEYNEDLPSMSVGERSVIYSMSSGIKLTDDEFIAIINHDKVDNLQSEWHNSIVGDILKCAIRLAIIEEKSLI